MSSLNVLFSSMSSLNAPFLKEATNNVNESQYTSKLKQNITHY